MVIYKSFRYRIYPTVEQVARLVRWSDALRFLWNLANEQRLNSYARPRGYRRYYTAFDQTKELTELRRELSWLADVPYNVAAQLLVELDQAWQRCFKRLARAPHWKRKGRDTLSCTETHSKMWRLKGQVLHFPKLGPIKTIVHRPLEGRPRTCAIKRDGDQWFVSVVCEIEISPNLHDSPVVAIDRGIINAIADSNGLVVKSPKHYEAASRRLTHAQRCLSRRKKGSNNREKARIRIMRLYRKIRRQRDHFLHVLSHDYANNHGTVVIEKLQIENMVKTSRWLARNILNAGWGHFAWMLRYKLAWNGGRLIEVSAAYSSQTCSACGYVDAKNRVSQSVFVCTACGYRDDADLNAAKVLKQRACESLVPACGGLLNQGALRNRKSSMITGSRCR